MTTAQEENVEIQSPSLDLDAMLADLHNDFQGEAGDAPTGDDGETVDHTSANGPTTSPADAPVDQADPIPELETVLPPGYVQVGDEVLPQNEVQALLELNRRVKNDEETARRVRAAVLNEQPQARSAEEADPLPAWLDPDDQQSVFLYRQNQKIERELEEVKRGALQRDQAQAQAQESARVTEVRDAFRVSMKEFRDEHPVFDLQDLNQIANRAASMGLLENPEAVGGTLKGGIVTALETAMWSSPEFREKASAGATVRSQEQQSATRKQKSSALSSSTGSVVRTQSQEQTPTTRQEIMAAGLDFLRTGAVTD